MNLPVHKIEITVGTFAGLYFIKLIDEKGGTVDLRILPRDLKEVIALNTYEVQWLLKE